MAFENRRRRRLLDFIHPYLTNSNNSIGAIAEGLYSTPDIVHNCNFDYLPIGVHSSYENNCVYKLIGYIFFFFLVRAKESDYFFDISFSLVWEVGHYMLMTCMSRYQYRL